MKVVEYYRSTSGNTKFTHTIYNEDNLDSTSLSSLILLNHYYKDRDEDFLKQTVILQDYFNKRFIFLLKQKKKFGDIVCHYCNKPKLEIGYRHYTLSNFNNKNQNLATIDHVIPISKSIDKLDELNWVVSCKKCNIKKGNKDYNEFKRK